jgi:hypothetical protein
VPAGGGHCQGDNEHDHQANGAGHKPDGHLLRPGDERGQTSCSEQQGAHPEPGALVVFTTRLLDGVLRACYQGLISGARGTGAIEVQGR